MIARCLLAGLLLLAGLSAHARESLVFHYIGLNNDPLFEARRAYTGQVLRQRYPALQGIETGLKESKVLGRSLGLKFELRQSSIETPAEIVHHLNTQIAAGGQIFLLDLPADAVAFAGRAGSVLPIILINVRSPDDGLRSLCARNLLHTVPSRAMLADGLAQYLFALRWTEILLLLGEQGDDLVEAESFARSAEKFGLEIVERRSVTLSNDPRKRDENNLALLTGDSNYDAVYVADTVGEFGRYVPFATILPRPVVGSEGLVPTAWHWSWERHGAPQLNQRFDKRADRRMNQFDWAGWAAIKSVVEAVVRTKTVKTDELLDFLLSDRFNLDTYKGAPGAFRPWSGQLRQPILLATHNAVIERAPIEGFLHPTNNLDTLGLAKEQSPCSG